MAELNLDIPEPIAEDPDAVVTALETAAIFGSRGDGAEALRWLKRAAESASEYNDDVRTLTLARAAADLTGRLAVNRTPSSMAPNSDGQRRLPKPPSRPSSLRPVPDAEPAPSVPPVRSSLRPPPPSARTHSPTPPQAYDPRAHEANGGMNGHSVRPLAQSFRPSQPAPEIRTGSAGLRAAARVSVTSSGEQPGQFTVRVLEEGEAVQYPALEAFLVFADPNSRMPR